MEMKDRIRIKRESLGYSKNKLAKLAGVSPTAISKVEKGGSSRFIVDIARALGVSAEYLMTGRGKAA